ncbi:MAG: Mor transcription activator family protein [Clostridia bacterium]|nr:Mor transcription activator family protein [Clostridia bacterium]
MEGNEAELFNDVYREIGNVIGLDCALAIYQMYKGQQITFPIHLFNVKRIQGNIIKEYDGTNIRELAKKYDYSEKTIRRMIRDSLEE